jgi:hypothetical protein
VKAFAAAVALLGAALPALAQEGSLDVLDGETLYEGGALVTIGYEFEEREGLLHGRDRVSDPLDRKLIDSTIALGAHYGLRYDLQLSAVVPYVRRTIEIEDPSGPDRIASEGPGDAALVAKWRYYRWDDVGKALNFAVLAGLELPTGEADAKDHGREVAPEFQPGSGSWDPSFGTAVTYEPGRWRFNAAVLYQRNGQGEEDFKSGDELFAELAAGNRFWLEPYPGPFMRFDVLLRHRHSWRSTQHGDIVHDSGGDLLTAGATLAFRPRPTIDLQLFLEIPVYQKVEGTQLEEDFSIFLAIGYRI